MRGAACHLAWHMARGVHAHSGYPSRRAVRTGGVQPRTILTTEPHAGPPPRPGPGRAGDPPPVMPAVRRVWTAGVRFARAHLALLRAELGVAGRELALVVGLAVVLLVLALLALVLLWVGGWLFLGEWLFGSLGWGIVHGTLVTIVVCTPIGLELAGGAPRLFLRALPPAVVAGVAVGLILGTNVLPAAADAAGDAVAAAAGTGSGPFPAGIALLVGALVGAIAGLGAVRGPGRGRAALAGLVVGALVALVLAVVRVGVQPAAALGVAALLVTWIGLGVAFAARRGVDPAARYDRLVPRATMAAARETRTWAEAELVRIRRKVVGR